MEQHPSASTLARYFSSKADRAEEAATASHLVHCKPCWNRAHGVLAELEKARAEEEQEALSRMRARARWAELTNLAPEQQIERINADADLRTREMFATVIEAASSIAPDDPFPGERTALVAYALAGSLSTEICSEADRNDLQSEALGIVSNCRRLSADWRGSAEALKTARRHLECGTGEPAREARLLSIQASLASDIGQVEQAQSLLSRAASLYCKAGDSTALATVSVKEASILLAACHHEQAIARAEGALSLLLPKDTRLEMLARNIITTSLVFLGQPAPALKNYAVTRPLYEHLPERRNNLQADYLEALLLDSIGCTREAEKAFRRHIADLMEAELYKDAFLTMLTRFELLFRRGVLDEAAQACQEAIKAMQEADVPCQEQMEGLWNGLLALVKARKLSEYQLLTARLYLVRHWNSAPAPWSPLEGTEGNTGAAEQILAQRSVVILSEPASGAGLDRPAPEPDSHYEAALERYDRALIMMGLAQCGGRVLETARLLRLAPGTLRAKIKRYGLVEMGAQQQNSAAGEADGTALDRLSETDRALLGRITARVWWRDLQSLSASERLTRIKSTRSLQTRDLADTILEAAAASALSDPRRGEEAASLAYALAGILPPSRCPSPVRHDLQGVALGITGNCRRLSGDWHGSAAAFANAGRHLGRGTGDPGRGAKLLSFQAALAADMGHHKDALALLARVSAIYRSIGDAAGVAFTATQEGSALLAAGRHAEAIDRAHVALALLAPSQIRLEILARNIITSSHVYLGRTAEALRSLRATWPLFQQLRAPWCASQLEYLEALVLDSLGFHREADAMFSKNIGDLLEAGLYKDAFLTLLTRFELLFKRGDVAKAARVCEEAIERLKVAGQEHHAQTIQLWRDLMALVDARRLTDLQLLETRTALVRCWAPPMQQGTAPSAMTLTQQVEQTRRTARQVWSEPPPLPARLGPGDYKVKRALYDRQIIAEGLAHCQGAVAETSRMLGIPRTTLRTKMAQYGLKAASEPHQ